MNKISYFYSFLFLNILLGMGMSFASTDMERDEEPQVAAAANARSAAAAAQPAASDAWPLLTAEDAIHVAWTASTPNFKQPQDRDVWDSTLNTAIRRYGLAGIHTHLETVDFEASKGGVYPANTTTKRAEALRALWQNPEVKAIQWGRGGFGGTQVLARLYDAGHHPERKIPVFGFSDATAYHLYCPEQPFFYAPMATTNRESAPFLSLANKGSSLKPMVDILRGNISEVSYPLSVYNSGKITGDPLVSFVEGGNTSVILRHNGTPQQLKADEAILFLEDFGEELCYRFESVFFTGALRSRLINKSTKALFLGNMPHLTETDLTAIDVIGTMLQANELGHIPILHSEGFGHGDVNGILPFNTPAVVKFSEDKKTATITIQTRQ